MTTILIVDDSAVDRRLAQGLLEKNAQFLEFKCVSFSEDLIYGHLRKK